MIDLGDRRHLDITITNLAGTLTDDATAALNITLPDQTTVGPFTPAHDSLGKYSYDYTTVQAGRHVARWTGTTLGAHTDVFDVEPAADISIVSLSSIKAQLGKTSPTDDDELRGYLLSVTENIEKKCGVCAIRSFTDRVSGDAPALFLPHVPVVSLTTFTAVYSTSPAVATADVTTNLDTGEVTRLDQQLFVGDYDVQYKAGRAVIQSSLRTAAQMIVQYLWETRRGGAVVSFAGEETVTLPGWGYAIPNRAAQLIDGFRTGPVFA